LPSALGQARPHRSRPRRPAWLAVYPAERQACGCGGGRGPWQQHRGRVRRRAACRSPEVRPQFNCRSLRAPRPKPNI